MDLILCDYNVWYAFELRSLKVLEHYKYLLLSGRIPHSQSREPGFESSICYRFEVCAFLFSPQRLSPLGCINEYLTIQSVGNVSE